MKVTQTDLNGLLIIEARVFEDSRGYFFESYHERNFQTYGIDFSFVQDNQSLSQYGVIRGLHYQLGPYAQSKLVRVLEGSVWDVAVDIRKNSPTFGKWFGMEISAQNKIQLYIPKGFAHGFAVTSECAVFFYKCDNYYHPESERGIHYLDEKLGIEWPIDPSKALVSPKDKVLPGLAEAEMNFVYHR